MGVVPPVLITKGHYHLLTLADIKEEVDILIPVGSGSLLPLDRLQRCVCTGGTAGDSIYSPGVLRCRDEHEWGVSTHCHYLGPAQEEVINTTGHMLSERHWSPVAAHINIKLQILQK